MIFLQTSSFRVENQNFCSQYFSQQYGSL